MFTLEDRLVQARFRPSGFDYLRISLAMSVIVWHSFGIPYGGDWAAAAIHDNAFARIGTTFILPSFFALSGFLVAGSLERTPSLFVFLGLRAIRIVPALGVEIVLSALLLGPLLTTLPLSEYFTSRPRVAAYFLNVVGDIHYVLPGVFETNPIPGIINGQLWTVPWELRCYIALAVLAVLGLVRHGRALILASLGAMVALIIYLAFSGQTGIDRHNDVDVPGAALVLGFLFGVVAYRYRAAIPYRADLFFAAFAAFVALSFVPYGSVLITAPIAYMTVYLGLWDGRRIGPVAAGDYSYGVYIYGFVIQQAIVSIGPAFRHWYVVLPLTTTLAICFAALSWTYVEKPALNARRALPVIEGRLRSLFGRRWPRMTSRRPGEAQDGSAPRLENKSA
jgi:peptidoglycan/LPS O-acetylase OafA/YrhL